MTKPRAHLYHYKTEQVVYDALWRLLSDAEQKTLIRGIDDQIVIIHTLTLFIVRELAHAEA